MQTTHDHDVGRQSLFILSTADRDRLAELAEEAGWHPIAARRAEQAERRFLAGGALVALVDARGEGAAHVALLGPAVESVGGALIALVDEGDVDTVPALIAAGATHYLAAPVTGVALAATLASARVLTSRIDAADLGAAIPAAAAPVPPAPPQRDFLTRVGNRQAALAWMADRLERRDGGLTLLLLSISQFDRVNAAYGQPAGDALLGRAARRIERLVEEVAGRDAFVARVAGTEFLVGLEGGQPGQGDGAIAIFLARRIIAALAQPFSAGDHLVHLTVRCGIAEAVAGDDAPLLLRRAGTALADAKQSSGDGIRILTADARSRRADPDRLETDLRRALALGEIQILFQPQYAAHSDAMTGVEALARWNHPHFGALGAGVLFAAAERSDFLLPLSAHIQAEALRLAAAWPSTLERLRLSVNVTALDLSQPDFVERFLALVDSSGFPRGRVTVEITETGLIRDTASAAQLLEQLREAGLAVAIDDFGTGYSSLAYLKALPLDYLKIDSGLAQDIAGSPRDRVIVRGVIQMAKSLGLKVIAEGVETEQQRDLLAREGCDYYQGFLRSPSVSSADLVAMADG